MDKSILIGAYFVKVVGTVDELHSHPQYQQPDIEKKLNHLKKTQDNFLTEKGGLTLVF